MKPDRTDLVFFILALGFGIATYVLRGTGALVEGAREALTLLIEVLPQLAIGLLVGGMVPLLVSQNRIGRLLGSESGTRGLLVATLVGAITPGGPFTSFPLVYALWVAGADVGSLVSFLASWSLIGLNRVLVWELPFMGVTFTTMRFVACLPLPLLAGLLARRLVRRGSDLRPLGEVRPAATGGAPGPEGAE